MGRPSNADKAAEAAIKKTFNDRPELPDGVQESEAVLSHNWQPDSPAIDLRYAGVSNTAVNVAQAQIAAQEEAEEKRAEKSVSAAEYERRTKLDVSDPAYINPSLDHVTSK